jgi:hypothetical protein
MAIRRSGGLSAGALVEVTNLHLDGVLQHNTRIQVSCRTYRRYERRSRIGTGLEFEIVFGHAKEQAVVQDKA